MHKTEYLQCIMKKICFFILLTTIFLAYSCNNKKVKHLNKFHNKIIMINTNILFIQNPVN